MTLATIVRTRLRLFRRKRCGKIPVLVQDADDFNGIVLRPIEHGVRVDEQRAKSRRNFVPSAPQQRPAAKTIARELDFADQLVGNVRGGNFRIVPPKVPQILWPPAPRRSA
jgi:hypothetical protein